LRLAAILIVALSLSTTAAWFVLDRTPPSWDDGYYLTKSLELYDTLTDKGVPVYAVRFLKIMSTKPPLIAALPTPVYLAAGRRYRAAFVVNLAALALMFAAVYGIGKIYGGPRAGLIAVAAVGSMPVIYGLSHWYLVECGLVALVCAAVWVMAGWNESPRPVVLGVVCGLGLLMKASFPIYVVIPALYLLLREPRNRLSPAAAVVAVLAAPWYLANLHGMWRTVLNAGSAQTAKIYDTGEALSLNAIGRYLFDVGNAAPFLYLAALAGLALIGASRLEKQTRRGVVLALLWLSPVVFLALGHYRDIRYAAPLYPAAALVFAWMADAAIRRRGRAMSVAVGAVLCLGWLNMVQNSFGGPGRQLRLGGLLLNEPRFSYARVFDHTAWPQQQILADIYRASSGGEKRAVLLGTNALRFNADNFSLAAVGARFPFEIGTTAYFTDPAAAVEAVNRAAYFVYKEGGEPDEQNFNVVGRAAVRQAREGGRFVELPVSRVLPDGGTVHVLTAVREKQTGAFLSAGLDDVPDCLVKFADQLELAGIGVSQTNAGIEVKYRWRCLKPMDRDYWCFTHVVNREGRVVGYLDHALLDSDPPTHVWKPGDSGVERRVLAIPEGSYELQVGVFQRESGDRLRISESSFPTLQDRTAAMVPTRPKR